MSEDATEAAGICTMGPKKCPLCGGELWIEFVGTETQLESFPVLTLTQIDRMKGV